MSQVDLYAKVGSKREEVENINSLRPLMPSIIPESLIKVDSVVSEIWAVTAKYRQIEAIRCSTLHDTLQLKVDLACIGGEVPQSFLALPVQRQVSRTVLHSARAYTRTLTEKQ